MQKSDLEKSYFIYTLLRGNSYFIWRKIILYLQNLAVVTVVAISVFPCMQVPAQIASPIQCCTLSVFFSFSTF